MGKWTQVSGDTDFSGTGCTLALDDPDNEQVELVKITPWLELDSSALHDGYGFWNVESDTVNYDDMDLHDKTVQQAMKHSGLDAQEYQALNHSQRAIVITDYSGYDGESTSTSDFAEALPTPIDEIEFYRGKSKDSIEDINNQMRHEVTYKLYGGKFSSRKLPTEKAIALAFGDGPVVFELSDNEIQAVRYAYATSSGSYDWKNIQYPWLKPDGNNLLITSAEHLKKLLEALQGAPDSTDLHPSNLTSLQATYGNTFNLDWENKREQTVYLIDEDAKECRLLIDNILGQLGLR